MSYICYSTKELVTGQKRELVPIKHRKVNYNNFLVYQRGDRIYKQYMGTSVGFEIVQEVPISPQALQAFLEANVPEIVGEKTIVYEYRPRYISQDAYAKAESEGKLIVINEVYQPDEVKAAQKTYDDTFEKEEDFD